MILPSASTLILTFPLRSVNNCEIHWHDCFIILDQLVHKKGNSQRLLSIIPLSLALGLRTVQLKYKLSDILGSIQVTDTYIYFFFKVSSFKRKPTIHTCIHVYNNKNNNKTCEGILKDYNAVIVFPIKKKLEPVYQLKYKHYGKNPERE